jgi:hypothetical protein
VALTAGCAAALTGRMVVPAAFVACWAATSVDVCREDFAVDEARGVPARDATEVASPEPGPPAGRAARRWSLLREEDGTTRGFWVGSDTTALRCDFRD